MSSGRFHSSDFLPRELLLAPGGKLRPLEQLSSERGSHDVTRQADWISGEFEHEAHSIGGRELDGDRTGPFGNAGHRPACFAVERMQSCPHGGVAMTSRPQS
jgi:hypothetical protein